MPAVGKIAADNDWKVVTNIRRTCRLAEGIEGIDRCGEWAQVTLAQIDETIEQHGIDLILMTPKSLRLAYLPESRSTPAYETLFERVADISAPVAVIAPTAHGQIIGVDCPSLLFGDLGDCSLARDEALRGSESIVEAAAAAGHAVIDMNSFLCNAEECPAVIEDIVVRRDRNHLSSTFAESLAEPLERRLLEAFPNLEGA